MKRYFPFIAVLLLLAGCKTTEANYRAAYQTVLAKQQADREQSSADIAALGVEAVGAVARQQRPQIYIATGDTIPTWPVALRMPDFERTVPQFSVAVNQFEQKFNATAMTKRLQQNGFDKAFMAQAAGPVYYVITAATDSIEAVAPLLRQAQEAKSLGMGRDFPKVIRNTSFRTPK